ncbi:MAG TPA: class I SAM-dependent methyltransferase, partial [Deltaproteobacteria bacterium]|nr:class I SAM-dependent methyltransferase [Deltaproteobacteria bacterium]
MRRIQTGRLIALLIMVAGISTAGVSLHGLIERTYALGGPDELDVPYVPTPESVVEKMLDMAAVTGSDLVYDLGCGDGRIVIAAAKERGARGVGIDLDPERIRESKENAREARVTDRVMFVRQDLYNTDLRDATVVTLYLLPSVNLEIRPKLFKELKPGTRVVSHDFDMGEWTADQIAEVDGSMVYFWV